MQQERLNDEIEQFLHSLKEQENEEGHKDGQETEDETEEIIDVYFVRRPTKGEEDAEQVIESNPLQKKHPPIVPLILSTLIVLALIAVGILVPNKPLLEYKTIRVPAILLPLRSFSTTVPIIATGTKTYPATQAHGTLTITNGSILSGVLPKGLILTGKDGIEVTTDTAVFVPAGSASGYGVAFVSAHAATIGKNGNIATLDIDSVEGASIYIRNLAAFTGGEDSYSIRFITSQDRENALSQARSTLIQYILSGLLQSPCKETVTGSATLTITWTCQFVTYEAPPGKVLSIKVQGHDVILEIVFVEHPHRLTTK